MLGIWKNYKSVHSVWLIAILLIVLSGILYRTIKGKISQGAVGSISLIAPLGKIALRCISVFPPIGEKSRQADKLCAESFSGCTEDGSDTSLRTAVASTNATTLGRAGQQSLQMRTSNERRPRGFEPAGSMSAIV